MFLFKKKLYIINIDIILALYFALYFPGNTKKMAKNHSSQLYIFPMCFVYITHSGKYIFSGEFIWIIKIKTIVLLHGTGKIKLSDDWNHPNYFSFKINLFLIFNVKNWMKSAYICQFRLIHLLFKSVNSFFFFLTFSCINLFMHDICKKYKDIDSISESPSSIHEKKDDILLWVFPADNGDAVKKKKKY